MPLRGRAASRYSLRDLAPGRSAEQCHRFAYLAACCAQRLLHEFGTECRWLAGAGARWAGALLQARSIEDTEADVLKPYLAAVCESEAWLVDPVSFSKMSIQEACIRVQTEHFAGVVRRAAEAPGTRGVW